MSRNPAFQKRRSQGYFRPLLELLEARQLLASDFGDAPFPYPTLRADNGAEHIAMFVTLGTNRDTEADAVYATAADGDDHTGTDDEDGVTFGPMRVGQLGATATVNVGGGSAKLDAWIDFNGDGSWGGPGEQIADSVSVAPPFNMLTFDVPSWAADGITYARFRLSQAGDLGVGGVAADGEVEDYAVTIMPPKNAAGVFGGQRTITTAAVEAISVLAADMDGDSDTDVVAASQRDNKITWYENDGRELFTVHPIGTSSLGFLEGIFAADVDGDGDRDVLSAASEGFASLIAWYENDGSGNFTAYSLGGHVGAEDVFAADVDGDGDTDVISSASFGAPGPIVWWENDGSQNFGRHPITEGNGSFRGLYAVDTDSDGDIDVVAGKNQGISWFENDGSQNFTARTVSTASHRAESVFAADVDGDGDTDVLSASSLDDTIAWYENDGSENFTNHTINAAADSARSVFAVDVDGDGDIDVLSASLLDDKIVWYANDGSQNFTAHTISTAADGAFSVFAADVDGDGDLDVLSASINDDKIAWYENLPVTDPGFPPEKNPHLLGPLVPTTVPPPGTPLSRPDAITLRQLEHRAAIDDAVGSSAKPVRHLA